MKGQTGMRFIGTQSSAEKYKQMLESPLPALLARLAAPAIVSMLITSIYNMADTYFVGRLGSSAATGAVGVALPFMAIIQAIGFFFGHGSGNYISRALGSRQSDSAQAMATTGVLSGGIIAAVIAALGLIFLHPLVYLLGSTETIAPYATDYLRYIMIGMPWMVASLILNNQLRFQGSAAYGMIGIGAGGLLNIALDPLFIFGLNMGVGGAALATIISQFFGFCLLLIGTFRGGNISIRLRSFAPTARNYHEILRGGAPSLLRQGLSSLATICLNTAARPYGDEAIAAMSIVSRVMMFALSVVIGFGQGFQPVCGFNYGANRFDRVRQAFWFSVKVSVGALLALSVLGEIFAPNIVRVFMSGDNTKVVEIGSLALRLQLTLFPLMAYVTISNMMLQTIGMAGRASLLAMSRQGIFFIPTVLILPSFLGLLGVQLSQPISDLCSVALCVPVTLSVLRELKRGDGDNNEVKGTAP